MTTKGSLLSLTHHIILILCVALITIWYFFLLSKMYSFFSSSWNLRTRKAGHFYHVSIPKVKECLILAQVLNKWVMKKWVMILNRKRGPGFKTANCRLKLFSCSSVDTRLCTNEILNCNMNESCREKKNGYSFDQHLLCGSSVRFRLSCLAGVAY